MRVTNDAVDLVAEGFDLAIRATSAPLKDSMLTVRRLGGAGIGFYASSSYLARRGKPKTLLAEQHEWILHTRLLAAWKLNRGRARFTCDNFEIIRDLVRDGAGVGAIPDYFATPYVRAGTIEAITIPGRNLSGQVVMLYPSRGQVSRKVTAFRDYLLEWLERSPLD